MKKRYVDESLAGLRCALYLRVSTDEQVLHGYSLDAQLDELTSFAKAHKMKIYDVYRDEGYSARKKWTKRKEFVRMIRDVEAERFDVILFIKLDRWFRSIADYYKIQEVLEAHHVTWMTTMEQYDTTTANGRLAVNIRLSVAQDESDRDSERIKFVFDAKLKRKEVISGSLPIGLKIDENKHVVFDEDTKQIALDMFDHFEATNSKRGTLLFLKEKYDRYFCYDTIMRSLQNTLYKGEYRGDKNFCPALIAPDRFDRIQVLAQRNVRVRGTNREYIFTGLLVCSSCDHYLVGHTSKYSLANGTKVERPAYRCNQHYQSHSCERNRTYREDFIEEAVLQKLFPVLHCHVAEWEVRESKAAAFNPAAEAQRIRKKMSRLKELFVNDLIQIDEYKKDYEELSARLEELTEAQPIRKKDMTAVKELLNCDISEIFQTLTAAEKRSLLKSVIEKIIVHEDGTIDIIPL